jgi:high-affinity iron transporter
MTFLGPMGRQLASFCGAMMTAITLLPPTSAAASATKDPAREQHVRRMVSLIDYVAGDYPEAVHNGQIVSTDEYAEMQDFVRGATSEFALIKGKVPIDTANEVQIKLGLLAKLLNDKADVQTIRPVIKEIKTLILAQNVLATSPEVRPQIAEARQLFAAECASCHGDVGGGDGPAAQGMEPPPRNFHAGPVMDQSSPFKFYNALELGIAGTTMGSFAERLTPAQRWSLAFYIPGLRYGIATMRSPEEAWQTVPEALRKKVLASGLTIATLARSSDAELAASLEQDLGIKGVDLNNTLAHLRKSAAFASSVPLSAVTLPDRAMSGELPSEPEKNSAVQSLQLAATKISEAEKLFAAGERKSAEECLFDAYLEGFDPAERALSLRHRDIVARVEQTFIAARASARAGDSETFASLTKSLQADLRSSVAILSTADSGKAVSSWAGFGDFFASLVIILREGFEAFLVIAALLTLSRKTGSVAARKWIHLGWMAAIVAGIATYFLFTLAFQVSGATRETIEAFSTALAALCLFYVSFWLLHQAERSRWDHYIKSSASSVATSGSRIGTLFFVAFIAVYREAAETVLFYQALISSAAAPSLVVIGFVAGSLLLLGIATAIIHYGIRLPMRKFFLMTSTLMIAISIVLIGKAVHELISAGFIEPTPMGRFPVIDALGIYPHWESIGVQLVALVLAGLLAYLSVQRGRKTSA